VADAATKVCSSTDLGSQETLMMMNNVRRVLAVLSVALVAAACSSGDALEADAGPDFTIAVGDAPSFDGCASSGEVANYQWVILEAPADMASDVGKELRGVLTECSFSLENSMVIDEVGSWTIELLVTDSDGNSSSDSVQVDITS
jgi:hypothetical protein